jgi:BASS family bile acid:Na+ symporter
LSIAKVLKNRNFIFILAFILGLSIGNYIEWIRHLTLPALAIVMTVSMTEIPLKSFLPLKSLIKPVLLTIILNYFVFAAVMLTMAYFIIPEKEIWIGFVIIAFAPPGVSIPPFTSILGGDVKFSLIGVIGAYIAAMIILPSSGIILVGQSFIQPIKLIIVFAELIAGPLILSQIFIKLKIDKYILKYRGPVVNWGLFIVILSAIGLNRSIFFDEPKILGKISIICMVTIIGLGFLYEFITKRLKIGRKLSSCIILLGTIKNGGFAVATSLALFGDSASLPGAISSIFTIIFLLYLSFRARKTSPSQKN